MANRLANETSPYLLQHAENPVDWYPWGDEAFATARAQDKPVLLSIGYSACHWCHVMAHESFEDRATAEYINQHFVAVKVDREERPDVDDIYMQATLFFNRGQGGWPMTVFLTPDGLPFHAGTYYPPEPRYGMPGFRQVMEAVIDVYRNRRDEVEQTGRGVISELSRELEGAPSGADLLTTDLLDDASDAFIRRADPVHGGLTREKPKFPNPVNLEYLLRFHHATGSEPSLQVVLLALRKMADGGLNDQLGGGFHRYSVDERWLVPHFEKMLYDNALLARVYLHAYQITGEMVFRDVVEDTLDYILREMTSPNGGFYSAQDADSEGEEGKFYVWTFEEFREALDGVTDHLDALIAYWGLTPAGNFEGKNILNVPDMLERVAVRHGLTVEQMREEVAATRAVLFTLRKRRVAPARDDKVLAAWNGMTLAALAEAARVLDRDDYRDAAARSARFLLGEMSGVDGRLFRTHKDGASKINAYLEDYAHVIDGLLELYMTTFETRWFSEAQRLADVVLEHFRAEEGGFYDTSDDHDPLVMRPRSTQDNVMPSGSAQMAYNLLRLTGWTGETRYEDAALGVYRALGETLRSYPMAFGMMLIGVDLYLRRPVEIALVGDPSQPEIGAMLRVAREPYRPRALVALSPANAGADAVPALLRGRTLREGSPAGYVCENFVCAAPVTSSAALAGQLNRASPERGLAPGR